MIDIESEQADPGAFHIPSFLEPPPAPGTKKHRQNITTIAPSRRRSAGVVGNHCSRVNWWSNKFRQRLYLARSVTYFEPIWHLVLKHPWRPLQNAAGALFALCKLHTWSTICRKTAAADADGMINGTALEQPWWPRLLLSHLFPRLSHPSMPEMAHPLLFGAVALCH